VPHTTDDVFGISRGVPLNYVVRPTVDGKFVDNLTRAKHVVVYGSSKQGKTSLRKHCLQEGDYIVVTCSNRWQLRDIHAQILKEAGFEVTQSTTHNYGGEMKVNATFKLLGAGVDAGLSGAGGHEQESAPLELDLNDVNDVIRALKSVNFARYVVLEDFHYLPTEAQRDFAVSLKAFHESSEICFVVVGVWLDENRLTIYNGDLTGRIVAVDADTWTDDELKQVILKGADLLNVRFAEDFIGRLIAGCQGSVAIVQEVCNRACKAAGVSQTAVIPVDIGDGEVELGALLKAVVDEQGGRYNSFLVQFAAGFQSTSLEMYRWLLYPVLTEPTDDLAKGLALARIRAVLNAVHPQKPLNTGNITQALQAASDLQVKKEVKPIILDYDETNLRLNVVDRGFLIWREQQDRADLLARVELPAGS